MDLLERNSVFLSGSIGWGIKDESHPEADWDLHLILSEGDFRAVTEALGPGAVIDDHAHRPQVFGQFHPISWLDARLGSADPRWWPLYAWIYKYGQWVYRSEAVGERVEAAQTRFRSTRVELLQGHFVRFCSKKNGLRSSAQQGLDLEADLYQAECVKLALQTYCLALGEPYPYEKWLPRFADGLGGSADLIRDCRRLIACHGGWEARRPAISRIESGLIAAIRARLGEREWLGKWWIYQEN